MPMWGQSPPAVRRPSCIWPRPPEAVSCRQGEDRNSGNSQKGRSRLCATFSVTASSIMFCNAGWVFAARSLRCQRKDSAFVTKTENGREGVQHGNREVGKHLAQWQAHSLG